MIKVPPHGYGAIGMFELAPVGVPIALLGIIFLMIAAPRLMPSHRSPVCELKERENRRYLAELGVPKESPLIGQGAEEAFQKDHPSLEVLELIRYSHIFYPDGIRLTLPPMTYCW